MPYRILSLDGGGSWSIIQALALAAIYGKNTSGQRVLSDFDMVAANSGGSIVLGALLENLSLAEIIYLFESENERRKIFTPTKSLFWRIFGNIVGPRYSEKAKLPAILQTLPKSGNKPLASVAEGIQGPNGKDVHLLIVAFNYYRKRATFLRSAEAGGITPSGWGISHPADSITLAECIHASTNAPLKYFDAPATLHSSSHDGELYWDGAITGNNNPVLAAVIEAITLGCDPSQLSILSIGTGSVVLPVAEVNSQKKPFMTKRTKPGFVGDLKKLAQSILDDPPDAATYMAHVITGSGKTAPNPAVSRVVRMNPLISPIPSADNWEAPANLNAAQFNFLANIDMDANTPAEIAAIKEYAVQWLDDNAPNQPIRMNGKTLSCEVGYKHFSAAFAAWLALNSDWKRHLMMNISGIEKNQAVQRENI